MPKKIAIIGPAYPYRGGIATFNERLADELQRTGHTVELITFSLQYPAFLFPGKTQLSTDPAPAGLQISCLINTVNPANWVKTGYQLKNKNYDLILLRYWMPFFAPAFGTMARIIRGNKHTTLVALTDNVIPHEKRPGDSLLTRFFLKQLDSFIYMSGTVGKDLEQFVPEKPKYFHPHPVFDTFGEIKSKEAALAKLKLPVADKYLLFFGLVREYKGLDILLHALTNERLKALNLKLIIAGEFYGDEAKYRALIQELHLTDQVILRPFYISDKEVADYFCASDVLVLPYRTATQSGVTQIAYQYNKPMIVTNVGGLPELVPNGEVGFVTDVSAEAIADAIFKFYDQAKETAFAANIAEFRKRFSWQTLAQLVAEL